MSSVLESSDDESSGKSGDGSNGKDSTGQDEVFEVEKIMDTRKLEGVVQYRVRWKGYAPKYDTWEPEDNLSCDEKLTEFKERKKRVRSRTPIPKSEPSSSKKKASSEQSGSKIQSSSTQSYLKSQPSTSKDERIEETVTSFYEQLRREELERSSASPVQNWKIQECGKDQVESAARDIDTDSSTKKPKPIQFSETTKKNDSAHSTANDDTSSDDSDSGKDVAAALLLDVSVVLERLPSEESTTSGSTSTTEQTGGEDESNVGESNDLLKGAELPDYDSRPQSPKSNDSNEVVREEEQINESEDGQKEGEKDEDENKEVVSPETVKLLKLIGRIKSKGDGRVQLLAAVSKMDPIYVGLLLDRFGPDQIHTAQMNPLGMTLIHLCGKRQDNSKNDQCRIIDLLVQYGVDIDVSDVTKTTPLMYFCNKGSLCCLKTFLKYRPHLDTVDKDGETALFAAVRRKNPEMIELLVKKGACCTWKNKRGQTVMDVIDEELRGKDSKDTRILKDARIWIQNFADKMESGFKQQVMHCCQGSVELLRPISSLHWFSRGGKGQLEFDGGKLPKNEDCLLFLFGFKLRVRPNHFDIVGPSENEKPLIESVQSEDKSTNGKPILVKCLDVSMPETPKVVFLLETVFRETNRVIVEPVEPEIENGETVIFQVYAVKVLPATAQEPVPSVPITVTVNLEDLNSEVTGGQKEK